MYTAHRHNGRLHYAKYEVQARVHSGIQSVESCVVVLVALHCTQCDAVQCVIHMLNVCEAMAKWVTFEVDL